MMSIGSERWINRLPNVLTLSRIPLGAVLPFLATYPVRFTVVLVMALLTDIADGWMARRLSVAGSAGARLDSVADSFLYIGSAIAAIIALPAADRVWPLILIGSVMLIRIACLVTVRRRFGIWAGVHTMTNRVAGGTVGIIVLWSVWFASLSNILLVIVAITAWLASLEELWIVSTSQHFDGDDRGLLADIVARSRYREHG